MQENEELRSRLYDTHNTLAAAGGEGASEEHWRERAKESRATKLRLEIFCDCYFVN